MVEAGEQIGTLQNSAAAMLCFPVAYRVISAGHDIQFALFGAGADQNEPVLSSGTWEILMVRSAQVDTSLLSHTLVAPANWIARQGCMTGYPMAGIRRVEWVGTVLTAEHPGKC
ncbi:hypothetical protein ACLK19_18755 [Escherichia coli]